VRSVQPHLDPPFDPEAKMPVGLEPKARCVHACVAPADKPAFVPQEPDRSQSQSGAVVRDDARVAAVGAAAAAPRRDPVAVAPKPGPAGAVESGADECAVSHLKAAALALHEISGSAAGADAQVAERHAAATDDDRRVVDDVAPEDATVRARPGEDEIAVDDDGLGDADLAAAGHGAPQPRRVFRHASALRSRRSFRGGRLRAVGPQGVL
jgi:hypothetical protein